MPRFKPVIAAVVLLVQPHDDDSREMYMEFFRHHGLEVLCPANVEEALALAPKADVIVTEIRLPVALDGYQFIQRLRADEQTRQKPIIVVTSWAWQTEKLRAEEAGCNLFLTKPCLPNVLLRHVRRAVTATTLRGVSGGSTKSDANDSLRGKPKRTA